MSQLDEIEILSFDCYGTLIDWESGIREALGELRQRHGLPTPVDRLLVQWEAIQFRQIGEPYRRYRDILRSSLSETFAGHRVALTPGEAELLGERIGQWQPFADSAPALARLRTRYRLAILSNIDDDILALSLAQLGISFDELVTAEQVGSYKPRPAHFREAVRRFGRGPRAFLHCAFGFKYDQSPALAEGMATCWVKRPGWIRDDEAEPTFETDSLTGVAELLGT